MGHGEDVDAAQLGGILVLDEVELEFEGLEQHEHDDDEGEGVGEVQDNPFEPAPVPSEIQGEVEGGGGDEEIPEPEDLRPEEGRLRALNDEESELEQAFEGEDDVENAEGDVDGPPGIVPEHEQADGQVQGEGDDHGEGMGIEAKPHGQQEDAQEEDEETDDFLKH
jgi:hypothetical protein